jgi:tetratricopeptide (TPR) repeat protein
MTDIKNNQYIADILPLHQDIPNPKKLNSSIKSAPEPIISNYIVQIAPNLEDMLIEGMDKGIQGDYEAAIQIFTEILTLFPDSAATYYNRGFAYTKLGDEEQAISDYNQAILLDANFAEAYFERGRLLSELGDNTGALQDLFEAANLFKQQNNYHAYEEALEIIEELK